MRFDIPLTRRAACMLGVAAFGASSPFTAFAQAYPNKPVKVIVTYAPGGANDITARIYSQILADRLKQPFVVENRPGASGITGTTFAAKSDPDGYTLLLGAGGTMTINPGLFKDLSYDPLKDFVAVGLASRSPLIMVIPASLPIFNVAELIAYANSRPEGITFASPGSGTPLHLAGELFSRQARIKALHVPYKGSSPAITDLVAARVDLMFDAANSSIPFVRSGKLRALAVTTAKRSDQLPEVPTLQEEGFRDFDVSSWFGLFAPANTPREIVTLLNAELATAAAMPETKKRLVQIGLEATSSSGTELHDLLKREQVKWKELIEQANIKPE